jgi:alpha-N-arabinofuranosidase
MIVAARSTSPTGPYEGCPHNPLLTHRCELASPIEHTGHGDLVQAPDGSWWIVFLAVRTYHGRFHLGRETFLAPVTWTANGWPVINEGRPVTLEMEAPLPAPHPWPEPPVRDDFSPPDLGLQWNFRRNPDPNSWSLTERPGWLRLWGTAQSLDANGALALVGRRQQHFCCRARAQMSFAPDLERQEAGLTVLMNEEHHYEIALTVRSGQRGVLLRKRIGDLVAEVAFRPYDGSSVIFEIEADHEQYTFSYGTRLDSLAPLGKGLVRYLSQHVADGFTGVYLAMYATGNGQPCAAPADYAWFDYEPLKDKVTLGWDL